MNDSIDSIDSIEQTSGVTRRQALRGAASRASLAALGRGQGASAQSATPSAAGDLTISKPELTTAGLQAILNAAIAKAEELKVPSIVTVLDSSGVQQVFFRMENAPMISYELSPLSCYHPTDHPHQWWDAHDGRTDDDRKVAALAIMAVVQGIDL